MPQFSYSGFRHDGEAVAGLLDAPTEQAALQRLEADGVIATDFGPGSAPEAGVAQEMDETHASRSRNVVLPGWLAGFMRRVPLATRTLFMRELATFVKADVPLLEALDVLRRQEQHEEFRRVLGNIYHRVHGGELFSQALGAHPRSFTPLHVNMVRVGETGGMLAEVLEQLATWMEHEESLRGEVRGALTYPIIILALGCITVIILFSFVLPRITSVFSSEMQLPWITRAMMAIAELFRHQGWMLLLGIIALAFGFQRLLRTTAGRNAWDRFVLSIPLFGNMLRKAAVARWARASAALLAGGVPLLETLRVVRGLLNNSVMIAMIEHTLQRVTQGQSLARSVEERNLLPAAVIHLLGVGERTGRLAEMFEHVAAMAERQLRNQIRVVLNLLPPLLIMGLAIMVATIAMAILLPIFRLNTMMR